MRSLLLYKLDGSNEVLGFVKPLLRIGRGADNDVLLKDPLRRASRFHAQIGCDDAGKAAGSVREVAFHRSLFQSLSEVELKGRQQKLNIYSVPWEAL